MEEESTSFFTRLRKLCREVDLSIGPLKESLSIPPRGAPHLYDRGLNRLKKEVQDLKEMNEEMKKTQRSLQNFSNWLQSMQEFVDKQVDDVDKLEKFLVKFGYVPVEKPATAIVSSASLNQAVTVREQISCSKDLESEAAKSEAKSQSTGTSLLDSKDCQSLEENKTSCEVSCKKGKNKPDFMEHQKTPTLGKMRPALILKKSVDAGSYGSCLVTVEQWLQGVENASLQVTPDVVRVKKLPMKKQEISRDCDKMPNIVISESVPDDTAVISESREVSQEPVKNNIPTYKSSIINACGLPVEPELSEYTTQFLKSIASNIRGNQASSQGKELHSRNIPGTISNSSEQSDHKEPSHFSCNEDMSTQNLVAKMDYTPEKPVLSYSSAKLASGHGVNESPKGSLLYYQPSKHGTKIEVECKTPKKPVLTYASEYAVVKEVETRHPGEPVLSTQMINRNQSVHTDITTTRGPLLSYQSNESETVNSDINRTPEKLILSPDASPMLKSSNSSDHLGIQKDLPVSPELSDITVSLLSLKNRMDGQDHPNQYSHENSKLQFSRNGKLISQVRRTENDVKGSNEDGCGVEPRGRKNLWLSSVTAMEKFSMDALPPSPQLSETTMKLLSRIK